MDLANLSIDETNLQETVRFLYKTVQRQNKSLNRTLEKNHKVTSETSSYLSQRQQKRPNGLAESFSYNLGSSNVSNSVLPRRQSCSILDIKSNENSYTSSYNSQRSVAESSKENISKLTNNQSGNSTSSSDNGRKKTKSSPDKIRSLVFRTLDKLLLVQKPKSKPEIGLNTLKQLSANVPDTLPRDPQAYSTNSFSKIAQNIGSNAPSYSQRKHVKSSESKPGNRICKDVACETQSSSDDDNSWIFVREPLKIEDVIMEDSLEYSKCKEITPKKNRIEASLPNGDSLPAQKKRYLQKVSKTGASNKIKQRHLDRVKDKEEKDTTNMLPPVKIPRAKIRRPDSPILSSKKLNPLLSSLPNLQEASSDTESLNFDCETNSFLRGIASRPSSTLSKSVPCVVETTPIPFSIDGDSICSSSSSFSSLQAPNENQKKNLFPDKISLQSALCRDVSVMPINVSIMPWIVDEPANNEIKSSGVNELSKKFIPPNEMPEGTPATVSDQNLSKFLQTTTKIDQDQLKTSHTSENLIDFESVCEYEISQVQKEFEWLVKLDSDGNGNVVAAKVSSEGQLRQEVAEKSIKHSEVPTNKSTLCPPPPLPPPMPSSVPTTKYKAFSDLPLTVFTNPKMGVTVFTSMESISLDNEAAEKLKENFPLQDGKSKPCNLSLSRSMSHRGVPKFKLNIEIFLKRWRIDFKRLLKSIKSLDAKNSPQTQEMACIPTLIQAIPKDDEIQFLKSQRTGNSKDRSEELILGLSAIPRFREKLKSIQFSLEFKDSIIFLSKYMQLFTSACDSLKSSTKFAKILEVNLAFLKEYKQKETEIFGFDIQSLKKLANKLSKDGKETLLHFIIEYIVDNPTLNSFADFYLEFQDFAEVAKTKEPIKTMEDQFDALKKGLQEYGDEVKLVKEKQTNKSFPDLNFALAFHKTAASEIKGIEAKFQKAKQAFASCKEHYGLETNQVTEEVFFSSLSEFFTAYQRIHKEVIEKKKVQSMNKSKPSILRRLPPTVKVQNLGRRKSCGSIVSSTALTSSEMSSSPTGELDDQCLQNFLRNDKNARQGRRKLGSRRSMPPPKRESGEYC